MRIVIACSTLALKHDYAFLLSRACFLVALRSLRKGGSLELPDYTLAIFDLLLAHPHIVLVRSDREMVSLVSRRSADAAWALSLYEIGLVAGVLKHL